MARHIRGGGLQMGPEWSQVASASFAPLAAMNDAGLLTVDSQDAPDATQRAYVEGFMPSTRAEALVDWVNLNTDVVAIVPVEDEVARGQKGVAYPQGMGIALTRHLFPRKTWRKTTHVFTYLPVAPGDIDIPMAEAGLSKRLPDLVTVFCFDPQWGRSATSASDGLFGKVNRGLAASAKEDTPGIVYL
jgi:hypothetical protein